MTAHAGDEDLRERFAEAAGALGSEPIEVAARVLTPREAIGAPPRDDFALVRGKEKIVEARFRGFRGHAFSAAEVSFRGTVSEVLGLPLAHIPERAVFFAALNAVLASLGRIARTVHCRDEDPMRCGEELSRHVAAIVPPVRRTALIGYQPGMTRALAALARERGFRFQVTDMNPANVGQGLFGVRVRDGRENEAVIGESDVVFCTGSTVVNGTVWEILRWCGAHGTRAVFFGVSVQGPAALMGWETFCPLGRGPGDEAPG